MVRRGFPVVVAAFLALHAAVMTAYFIGKVPAGWMPCICKGDQCTFAAWFSAIGNWSGAVVAFATYFLLKRQIDVSVILHRQMIWQEHTEPMALAKAVFETVAKISTDAGIAETYLLKKDPNGSDERTYNKLIAMKADYSSPLFDRFEERFSFRSAFYIAAVRDLLNDLGDSNFHGESNKMPSISDMQHCLRIIIEYNAIVSTVAEQYTIGISRLVR